MLGPPSYSYSIVSCTCMVCVCVCCAKVCSQSLLVSLCTKFNHLLILIIDQQQQQPAKVYETMANKREHYKKNIL